MTALLNQPFLSLVGADASAPDMPPASEILIARFSSLIYTLVRRAPQGAILRAAASGSNAELVHALAEMVVTEAPADDAWTTALIQGSVALALCLEAAGGVWTADEAMTRLQAKRQTLQQWRDGGRVLALQRQDGSFSYPVAQFQPPASDAGVPRPYEAIAQINEIVASRLSPEELVALLATPQSMLPDAHGRPMTPFAAIASGDTARVLDLVRWVATPADEGAPSVTTGPAVMTTA